MAVDETPRLIVWKGPSGWLRTPLNEAEGKEPIAAGVTLIVDETDRPTVEFGGFALDDAALSRLISLVDSGAGVELRDREPFVRPDPTPAQMKDIQDNADRIRETMGDKAAEEYVEEQLGGAV